MPEHTQVQIDQPSYVPNQGEVDNLGNEALRLLKSGDPLDIQCAQVYATLALAMQVNSVGRLVGQIGQLLEERA